MDISLIEAEEVEVQRDYGNVIPQDPSDIFIDGESCDLEDPDRVLEASERLTELRTEMKEGDLSKYEGRSTDWGGGGRSRLLYDQVRVTLAQEYHAGRNNMSWPEQHQEAMDVVRIVAIKNRSMF